MEPKEQFNAFSRAFQDLDVDMLRSNGPVVAMKAQYAEARWSQDQRFAAFAMLKASDSDDSDDSDGPESGDKGQQDKHEGRQAQGKPQAGGRNISHYGLP